MWLGNLNGEGANHFSLFYFSNVLLEHQPPFGLDLGLLPDRVLSKELIGGGECRIVVNVWIPLE